MRTGVVSFIVISAIVAFALLWRTSKGPSDETTTPSAVESVSPAGGDLDLRQATILADLAPGYVGKLYFDGVEVPADDVQFIQGLNQVILRPKPGSNYEHIAPGSHCAAVDYHPVDNDQDVRTYRWCFKLH